MKKAKPWLGSNREPLPDSELKTIVKQWNAETWERYLHWFENAQIHHLLPPETYDAICESRSIDVFEEFGPVYRDEDRWRCRGLLSKLTARKSEVLRLCFLEELTEREVVRALQRPRRTIRSVRDRALARLRRGQHGDNAPTGTYMRGPDCDELSWNEPSPWDQGLSKPIREDRMYDPDNWKAELESVGDPALHTALAELTPTQSQIIYLRFWCDFSFGDISRRLNLGVNSVDEILSATLFKLKSRILEELPASIEGGFQCA